MNLFATKLSTIQTQLSWCGRTKRKWLKITAGWANVIQPLLEFVSNVTGHVPNITGNETHLSIFELWWLVEPLTNFKPALSQIYLTILYYISTIHWFSIQQSGPKMVFDNRWSFLSNSQKTSKTHFFKNSLHSVRPIWRYYNFGQLRCKRFGCKKHMFWWFPNLKKELSQAKNNPYLHNLPPITHNLRWHSWYSSFSLQWMVPVLSQFRPP